MEDVRTDKEVKITKRSGFRMGLKFLRMYFYKLLKGRWYLPSVSEITPDELHELMNSDLSPPPLVIDVTEQRFYRAEQDKPDHEQNKLVKLTNKKIPNAKLIPIMELTARLEDLQPYLEREIVALCPGGGMSLIAVDILNGTGFKNVKSLTGGMELWVEKGYPVVEVIKDIDSQQEDIKPSSYEDRAIINEKKQILDEESITKINKTVDARGLLCPHPILKSRKAIKGMKTNQVLEILTTDPGSKIDIPAWADVTGLLLISTEERGPKEFRFLIKKLK